MISDLLLCFFFRPSFSLTREEAAIKELLSIIQDKRTSGHQWAHLHIVHLSDASASLDLIKVIITSSFLGYFMLVFI